MPLRSAPSNSPARGRSTVAPAATAWANRASTSGTSSTISTGEPPRVGEVELRAADLERGVRHPALLVGQQQRHHRAKGLFVEFDGRRGVRGAQVRRHGRPVAWGNSRCKVCHRWASYRRRNACAVCYRHNSTKVLPRQAPNRHPVLAFRWHRRDAEDAESVITIFLAACAPSCPSTDQTVKIILCDAIERPGPGNWIAGGLDSDVRSGFMLLFRR